MALPLRRIPLFALLAALLPISILGAVPFTISGVLQEGDGSPLSTRHGISVQVEFFASESATVLIDSATTTCSIERGVFAVKIEATRPLLATQGPLWYEVSIDTDGNGIDEADRFGGRFELGPVFSSLKSEQLAVIHNTHGGFGSTIAFGTWPNEVSFSPFVTPSYGISFDFIAYKTAPPEAGTLANVAIYDAQGIKVASSGPHTVTWSNIHASSMTRTFQAPGYLEPDTTYYVAFVATNSQSLYPASVNTLDPFTNRSGKAVTSGAVLPDPLAVGSLNLSAAGVNLLLIRADTPEEKAFWKARCDSEGKSDVSAGQAEVGANTEPLPETGQASGTSLMIPPLAR